MNALLSVIGDATTAALLGGFFTIANTVLTGVVLRRVNGTRAITANAASAAADAAESAAEACRVAKAIGGSIRHEEPLIIAPADPAGPAGPAGPADRQASS